MSLFANDTILYIENPKHSTPKLSELINEFSKVEGYNINIQKSVAFLHISNELWERETEKNIPLKNNKINYLGMNLTKDKKDLYSENYKALKKEIEGYK